MVALILSTIAVIGLSSICSAIVKLTEPRKDNYQPELNKTRKNK